MVKTKKDIAAIIAIILLFGICVTLGITRIGAVRDGIPERQLPQPQKETVIKEVPKYIEIEKTVTSEMIQDGVRNMGTMVTGEYYFTGVMNHSVASRFFKGSVTVPFSESSFVASYDGFVSAGVNLTGATVEKDEAASTVTVNVPKPEIYTVDIDPESFILYSEKQSIFNPISVTDYNDALIELEAGAEQNAVEKGLLELAENNADQLIRSLIFTLVDKDEYRVVVNFK